MHEKCDRCGKNATVQTMSIFNREMICMPCKEEEKKLPEYAEACRIELAEVRKGNMNFEGVGLPAYVKTATTKKV